jgi:FkbM family methyltransferase
MQKMQALEGRQQALLDVLSERNNKLQSNSLAKLISSPYKIIAPRLLRYLDRYVPMNAPTFFGDDMHIVIPEAVSWRILHTAFVTMKVAVMLLHILKEGDTFIDIGAHFGFFSLLARKLVGSSGKVLSFEPTPSTYAITKRNCSKYSNCKVINSAVYNLTTTIPFIDYGLGRSAFNSFCAPRGTQTSEVRGNSIMVDTVRIDDIAVSNAWTVLS